MNMTDYFNELKKIHKDLKYLATDGFEAYMIFENGDKMCISEFVKSKTKNLLIEFENKFL